MGNFKGKLIVITGLDGSGTTTLGKYLSENDPNGFFMHTPNSIYTDVRDLFTDNVRDNAPAAHYHFYLSAVIAASYEIEEKLKTHNVYCVRYLIDTVVSHRVMGLPVRFNYDLGYYSIVKPDLTIFLDIDEKIRRDRIGRRGMSKLDMVLEMPSIRDRFISEFNNVQETFNTIKNNGDLENMYQQAKALIEKSIS